MWQRITKWSSCSCKNVFPYIILKWYFMQGKNLKLVVKRVYQNTKLRNLWIYLSRMNIEDLKVTKVLLTALTKFCPQKKNKKQLLHKLIMWNNVNCCCSSMWKGNMTSPLSWQRCIFSLSSLSVWTVSYF